MRRAVGLCRQVHAGALPADRGREVDGVLDAVPRSRINANELVAVANLNRLQHADVFAAAPLGVNSSAQEGLDIGQRAAVENGQFQVVDFDNDVIHAHADEGREQMFGGRNQDALAHQDWSRS